MKTKEELIALKEEIETGNENRVEMTDKKLEQTTGGNLDSVVDTTCHHCGNRVWVNPLKLPCPCSYCGEVIDHLFS